MPIRTLVIGVDCATDLKKVGVAFSVVASVARPSIEHLAEVSAERLADRLRDAISSGDRAVLALDSPLGWPASLGAALTSHRPGDRFETTADELFRRVTDQRVKARTGQRPFDIGADKIARTAHATLELLHVLRQLTGAPIPLAWQPDFPHPAACIEVYPAATLRACGLPPKGYKGKKDSHLRQRRELVQSLGAFLDVPPTCCPALVASDHALDAAICVLAGADFVRRLAAAPEADELPAAQREGWIWVRQRRDA